MRPGQRIQLAALAILLSLPLTGGAAEATRVGTLLDRVNTLLLGPDRTEANAREGFQSLLSAIGEVSSAVELPAEFAVKLAEARRGEPGGKTGALVAECYRLAHGGTTFRMPESVDSMERAVDHAQRRLAAARGLVASGQSRDALRALLEVAMVVVTPMDGGRRH